MQETFQKLRHAQEVALQALEAQGVTELPQKPEEFREVGWSHPLLWLLIGMASMTSLLIVPNEPPLKFLRFQQDILPLRLAQDDRPLLAIIAPTFIALTFCGRTLAGLVYSSSALQFIGESLVFFPRFGRTLIRWARRAGNDWHAVRRRWVLQLWAVVALQLVVHLGVLYRLTETYRAVFYGGVREIWPGHYQEYPWEALREIRPWCDENRKSVFYELRFRGGTFNLIRVDRQGLSLVNKIDRTLVEMGKPKRRQTEEGAKRCAAAWKNVAELQMVEEIFMR